MLNSVVLKLSASPECVRALPCDVAMTVYMTESVYLADERPDWISCRRLARRLCSV